ncbi:hypothetical protein A2617_04900 [Candidatus Daviesbacteria bacterium RIFOXYD1_FULL_41_10]|uniref:Transposase IS200-like domain-containing protein n=1 Tax=Candidatus Daviesbacteria bacterium RIFOXYD1_FULL_41_10 TaxID=1797801 RepID=A0A1F5N3D1_9BACT|nr:MAG: hypothetical protein A2617_04900 [Candidatus Daviesbacteria bacterium RIFOXYD1_FULL_41_10]
MPGRATPLVIGEYYHLFNRGSEKRDIFTQPRDYKRFLKTLYYYQYTGPKISFSKFTKSDFNSFKPNPENKLVQILCYCLMPNHIHFLLKQVKENGISIFMSQLFNSYTKYFNTKYNRVGALFQGVFKSVLMESDEQLKHTSRYIHLNPVVAGLTNDLFSYNWSSYYDFLTGNEKISSVNQVLNFFPSLGKYYKFVEDQVGYSKALRIIKRQAIDFEE